jgi:hypothetical protein
MSTSAPNPGGTNANMITVMQSLIQALNNLDQHSRALAGSGSQQYRAGSSTGGSTTTGGGNLDAALTDLQQMQQQQQTLATFTRTDTASQTGSVGGSLVQTVPNVPVTGGGGQGGGSGGGGQGGGSQQQAMNALTWEALGNLGGPLGAIKQRAFVANSYKDSASGLLSGVAGTSLFNSTTTDAEGNVISSAPNQTLTGIANTLTNSDGESGLVSGLATAGIMGASAIYHNTWAGTGQALGYGTDSWLAAKRAGNTAPYWSAKAQGAELAAGKASLYWNGNTGLTMAQSGAAVNAAAEAGFSDQGAASGRNQTVAQGIIAPAMAQGVGAQNAADLSAAVRNSGDSVQSLTSTLQSLGSMAKAASLTTDQLASSLKEFATSQVANGGTYGQADYTGSMLEGATGLAPSVFSTLQNNPVYQGIEMGQNGVLGSDIGNLGPGAQLQGVSTMLKMYGGAFSSLNKNKYQTTDGYTTVSSYGNAAEASAIAGQIPGMTQQNILQIQHEQQTGELQKAITAYNTIGSPTAGGGQGTGIYSILNGSANWKNTSEAARTSAATTLWDKQVQPGLSGLLTGPGSAQQIKQINSAKGVGAKAADLQKFMNQDQQNNAMNQISGTVKVQLEMTGHSKQMFKVVNQKGNAVLNQNSGGAMANGYLNSPIADADAGRVGALL